MVRRCFPVAKIVGSSPTGVAFIFANILFCDGCQDAIHVSVPALADVCDPVVGTVVTTSYLYSLHPLWINLFAAT